MIGQDLDFLYRRKPVDKAFEFMEIFVVIGNSLHKNVPYPDIHALFGEISCKFQHVFVRMTRKLFMLVIVDMLDIEKHQIGICKQFVKLSFIEDYSRRVYRGVNSVRF